ncbi:ATP-binding protein [Bacteroides heparinolyticus]|uniref:ATP-binding protein n=1 Tax=Prevotella heparinolytica TaxID=28113 RepID=UPI00359F180D
MLKRKIETYIEDFLAPRPQKILILDGARQTGKTFIIRKVGQRMFKNYVEINLLDDSLNERNFDDVRSVSAFYLQLSAVAGDKLGGKEDTLVFLDEIQAYPHLLTLLKFLNQDNRFTYIASGSELGITLFKTLSIPMGSIVVCHLYPLDFEEFLWANGVGKAVISHCREMFFARQSLRQSLHRQMMELFRKYLLVGGLPEAVQSFVNDTNIATVRQIQSQIHEYYGVDASKYDQENRLKIRRIYDMIPSVLENKKKRIVARDIEGMASKRFKDYQDEFDYLIASGIALDVKAISTPVFPLVESMSKNLLKLYLNDVGMLTGILFRNNINPILNDECSVNLGTAYESVVAQELKAHGFRLFYYDNKKNGEVDFLIDDYTQLSVLPLEVKSGKNYYQHSALNHFLTNKDYSVKRAIVFCNESTVEEKDGVIYMPVYNVMFLQAD